jgi:hypothetical protein
MGVSVHVFQPTQKKTFEKAEWKHTMWYTAHTHIHTHTHTLLPTVDTF